MMRKWRFGLPTWKGVEQSLVLRLGGAIAAIAMLAVIGMSVSGLVAESTQGSGEAINMAGSLRMKSWHMTSLYLAERGELGLETREDLMTAILDFEATLASTPIMAMLPNTGDAGLAETYQSVQKQWRAQIRPRFQAMAMGQAPSDASQERAALLLDIQTFVSHINDLVKRMEETTEAKILVMRLMLGGALLLTVLVVALTIHLIHTHFVQPLSELLKLSRNVGQGNLSIRTGYTGEDELGQLGRAFNLMTEDLSKLYENLELRVEQKTAELTRSNHSLELLYHSIARLHGAPPGKAVYLELLHDIEGLLDLGHGIICLGEQGGHTGMAVASTMQQGDCNPCDKEECRWCHSTGQTRFSIASNFHQHLTLPLADSEQQYGVLILEIPAGRHLEAWQVQLLEALSRHIGVAIGAEKRIEQSRRLALLEERAVIARELHDSLAQSLAYMKIQVSRMKTAMQAELPREKVDIVLEELRDGLNSAYRQLRELLSTFRLKMEDATLAEILARTVAEFSERGQLPIDLQLDMEGCTLSPNEEIHILHIIREALANVMHHAQASQARIMLSCNAQGMVEVVIQDDGKGIDKPADLHHYGMTIMEERARTLHGELRYEHREEGGTQVVLNFMPKSKRGNKESMKVAA